MDKRFFGGQPNHIDDVICAEIPPPSHSLHESVVKMMIHGPCGVHNPNLKCMRNGRCKYGYPKDHVSETSIGEDAYATYRRRAPDEGGHTARKFVRRNHQVSLTNSNVIPYSPYFLYKYDCHINFEYCASIQSMKYLFKYHFKGHDMATVQLQTEENEAEH